MALPRTTDTPLHVITGAGLSPKAKAEHRIRTALRGTHYEDVYPVPCTRNRWQLESFDRFGYIQKRLADIPGITNIVAETDYSTTPPLAMVQFDYVRVLSIADYRATQDTVIGPAGIVPIAEPEDIPAALEATGLIPVPGVPGLDAPYHTYMADVDAPNSTPLEDAPALPCDEPKPARAAMSIALARHIANATARQRLVGLDKGSTAARNRLPLTHTVSGDAFHYNTERGKGQAA